MIRGKTRTSQHHHHHVSCELNNSPEEFSLGCYAGLVLSFLFRDSLSSCSRRSGLGFSISLLDAQQAETIVDFVLG